MPLVIVMHMMLVLMIVTGVIALVMVFGLYHRGSHRRGMIMGAMAHIMGMVAFGFGHGVALASGSYDTLLYGIAPAYATTERKRPSARRVSDIVNESRKIVNVITEGILEMPSAISLVQIVTEREPARI